MEVRVLSSALGRCWNLSSSDFVRHFASCGRRLNPGPVRPLRSRRLSRNRSNIGVVSALHGITLIGSVDGLSDGMTLRPLADGDASELRRIHATPEVARWWDAPGERFP